MSLQVVIAVAVDRCRREGNTQRSDFDEAMFVHESVKSRFRHDMT